MLITLNLLTFAIVFCLFGYGMGAKFNFEAIFLCYTFVTMMSLTWLLQVIGFYNQKRLDFAVHLQKYDLLTAQNDVNKWIGCLDAESDINLPRLHQSVLDHSWHYTNLSRLIFLIISSVILFSQIVLCTTCLRPCAAFTGRIDTNFRVELDFFTTGYGRYN